MSAENTFGQFIADLFIDPAKIRQYLADPAACAAAAGLSGEETAVLQSGNFEVILDYASGDDDRPVGSEEEGGSG